MRPKAPKKAIPAAAPPTVSPRPLKLLTPNAAGDATGFGRTKILSLVRSGRIPCVMVDGRIRIPIEGLHEFRDGLPQGYVAGKPVKAEADKTKDAA